MDQGVTAGQLLLAEYGTVKDEQKARIGFRDNLLYVTLAVMAAVITAASQTDKPVMLLALPPVCAILGWTYLVNDQKISAIGAYVRTDLGPRLAAMARAGDDLRVFEWETAHRSDAGRTSRKFIQCLVDLGAFCVVPLGGLTVYWASGRTSGLLLGLSAAEALAIVGLGVHVVLYARPQRSA
ncbi:hypothetical protein ACIQ7D_33080 [Streptomyces sp. NPDC096310]|uniref:hypothetical protein n=1 Tax=Streptomyces sp. NPDC096310 TaxID=3366082 RepID=UPI00380FAF16